jgi:hypothetical protein
LFEMGRKNPGKLTYGYGSGSAQVAAAKLVSMGDIKTTPVGYKGSPQALTDVMSGRVDFMFVDLSLAIPQIEGGKLKALGVTTKGRFPVVPDIKSINESGAPGYELVVWFALGGPAKMPADVTQRVSKALNTALDSKDLQQKYAALGLAVKKSTPAQFSSFLKSEIDNWGALIKAAGIPAQDCSFPSIRSAAHRNAACAARPGSRTLNEECTHENRRQQIRHHRRRQPDRLAYYRATAGRRRGAGAAVRQLLLERARGRQGVEGRRAHQGSTRRHPAHARVV